MVYSWNKQGYSISAEIVGKEFCKIEKQYGALTSENVLESAKSDDSPLHDIFEWDDTIAANKYRLYQATKLICNLKCEVATDEEKTFVVRAYLNVSENKKGSFVNVQSAFENPDSRKLVLERALQELESFKNKYMELSELASVFDAIDLLVEKGA